MINEETQDPCSVRVPVVHAAEKVKQVLPRPVESSTVAEVHREDFRDSNEAGDADGTRILLKNMREDHLKEIPAGQLG
jgi:hypothetical protein